MTIQELHKHFLSSTGICTDTRKLESGQLYFALKGENFNGNAFAKAALQKGASLAIIDEEEYLTTNTVLVTDVLKTLQALASFHRNYLDIPIIGLTGSNGKTTTKELINAALSQKYNTTATVGNLNNHIGVPLTLLSMTKETEIGIVEMGANHQEEIAALCAIAAPNFGYITNFGKAHLEGFGGLEGIIKGKSELYNYLRAHNGRAFVNLEDPTQIKQSKSLETFTFGSSQGDAIISLISATPFVTISYKKTTLQSNLIGSYNAPNIAAAIAMADYFKIDTQDILNGIENYTPSNNRSQIIKKNGYTIILDAYNANPTSMEAALNNLSIQAGSHKVAFLGDMFEIGDTKESEHQNILKIAATLKIDNVFAVGPTFGISKPIFNTQEVYGTYDAFAKAYTTHSIPSGATILIKGSRGMAMERILDIL